MPDIRDKELRFRTLDKCFSNFRRKYTFDDLLEAVNEKLERADDIIDRGLREAW